MYGCCGIHRVFIGNRQIINYFLCKFYSQKCDVEERIATLSSCTTKLERFFSRWFITYHLHHPEELVKPIQETNNPYGYKNRYGFEKNLWKYLPRYEYFEREV